ncbi:MAG: hypothetical protein R2939_07195 [Kofleriaceae bacterium]
MIRNAGAGGLPAARVTLVDGGLARGPADAAPRSFTIAEPVTLAAGQDVIVELLAVPRVAAPPTVMIYEPVAEASLGPRLATECYVFPTGDGSTAPVAELAAPRADALPRGAVQLMRRRGGGVVPVGSTSLVVTAGTLRLPLAATAKVTGRREHTECRVDVRTRTLRERVEVTLTNPEAAAVEVLVREPMTRAPGWKIDAESRPGQRSGERIQEYRVSVPANGQAKLDYTVVYAW